MHTIATYPFIALAVSCSAFSVGPNGITTSTPFGLQSPRSATRGTVRLSENKTPFFANQPDSKSDVSTEESKGDVNDEIEAMVEEEMKKKTKISKLKTSTGVDYAPWMKISEKDEAQMRQVMREKAAARKAREEQEKQISGNLYLDSQAQELSGTGLKSKVIGEDVELEWGTNSETDCKGFVVRRRPAKTEEFSVIASYENYGPLASKGPEGGVYRYLDDSAGPGGWVYRVSEVNTAGESYDLCQCLVEVQTEDEQKAALFAGVGISVLAVLAVVAGLTLDPMGGY